MPILDKRGPAKANCPHSSYPVDGVVAVELCRRNARTKFNGPRWPWNPEGMIPRIIVGSFARKRSRARSRGPATPGVVERAARRFRDGPVDEGNDEIAICSAARTKAGQWLVSVGRLAAQRFGGLPHGGASKGERFTLCVSETAGRLLEWDGRQDAAGCRPRLMK